MGTDQSLRCSGNIPELGNSSPLAIIGVGDLSLSGHGTAKLRILDALDLAFGECKYAGTLKGKWSRPEAISLSFTKATVTSVKSESAPACPTKLKQTLPFQNVGITIGAGPRERVEADT
jgi:hypothetical protein